MEAMSADLGLRVLTVALTSVTVFFLVLLLTTLSRASELQKAKLFLHFNKLHRIHTGAIALVIVGLIVNMGYMTFLDRRIFQPDYFRQTPFGVFTVIVHVAFVLIAMANVRIFRAGSKQEPPKA